MRIWYWKGRGCGEFILETSIGGYSGAGEKRGNRNRPKKGGNCIARCDEDASVPVLSDRRNAIS